MRHLDIPPSPPKLPTWSSPESVQVSPFCDGTSSTPSGAADTKRLAAAAILCALRNDKSGGPPRMSAISSLLLLRGRGSFSKRPRCGLSSCAASIAPPAIERPLPIVWRAPTESLPSSSPGVPPKIAAFPPATMGASRSTDQPTSLSVSLVYKKADSYPSADRDAPRPPKLALRSTNLGEWSQRGSGARASFPPECASISREARGRKEKPSRFKRSSPRPRGRSGSSLLRPPPVCPTRQVISYCLASTRRMIRRGAASGARADEVHAKNAPFARTRANFAKFAKKDPRRRPNPGRNFDPSPF